LSTGHKYEGPQILSNLRATSDVEPVSRILYGIAAVTVIPLGRSLLIGSSDLPGSLARRAGTHGRRLAPSSIPSLFGLAPCGVCPASSITARAVRSYRTFSPLPWVFQLKAVYFLWHCPSSHSSAAPKRATKAPSRTLSGTLLCGVRTFLSLGRAARETRRPQPRQRPSGPTSTTHIIR
jgi:hypothetical protein